MLSNNSGPSESQGSNTDDKNRNNFTPRSEQSDINLNTGINQYVETLQYVKEKYCLREVTREVQILLSKPLGEWQLLEARATAFKSITQDTALRLYLYERDIQPILSKLSVSALDIDASGQRVSLSPQEAISKVAKNLNTATVVLVSQVDKFEEFCTFFNNYQSEARENLNSVVIPVLKSFGASLTAGHIQESLQFLKNRFYNFINREGSILLAHTLQESFNINSPDYSLTKYADTLNVVTDFIQADSTFSKQELGSLLGVLNSVSRRLNDEQFKTFLSIADPARQDCRFRFAVYGLTASSLSSKGLIDSAKIKELGAIATDFIEKLSLNLNETKSQGYLAFVRDSIIDSKDELQLAEISELYARFIKLNLPPEVSRTLPIVCLSFATGRNSIHLRRDEIFSFAESLSDYFVNRSGAARANISDLAVLGHFAHAAISMREVFKQAYAQPILRFIDTMFEKHPDARIVEDSELMSTLMYVIGKLKEPDISGYLAFIETSATEAKEKGLNPKEFIREIANLYLSLGTYGSLLDLENLRKTLIDLRCQDKALGFDNQGPYLRSVQKCFQVMKGSVESETIMLIAESVKDLVEHGYPEAKLISGMPSAFEALGLEKSLELTHEFLRFKIYPRFDLITGPEIQELYENIGSINDHEITVVRGAVRSGSENLSPLHKIIALSLMEQGQELFVSNTKSAPNFSIMNRPPADLLFNLTPRLKVFADSCGYSWKLSGSKINHDIDTQLKAIIKIAPKLGILDGEYMLADSDFDLAIPNQRVAALKKFEEAIIPELLIKVSGAPEHYRAQRGPDLESLYNLLEDIQVELKKYYPVRLPPKLPLRLHSTHGVIDFLLNQSEAVHKMASAMPFNHAGFQLIRIEGEGHRQIGQINIFKTRVEGQDALVVGSIRVDSEALGDYDRNSLSKSLIDTLKTEGEKNGIKVFMHLLTKTEKYGPVTENTLGLMRALLDRCSNLRRTNVDAVDGFDPGNKAICKIWELVEL